MYLITNSHLNESGIYKITYKTMANETGVDKNIVIELIKESLNNNVTYDEKKNVIFVHKFLKYNGSGNPQLIKKSIQRDRILIKTTLWKAFDKYYTSDLNYIENDIETNPSIPIPNTNSNANSNKERVFFEDEFESLWKKYHIDGRKNKKYAKTRFMALCKQGKLEEFKKGYKGYANYLEFKRKRQNFEQAIKYFSTLCTDYGEYIQYCEHKSEAEL